MIAFLYDNSSLLWSLFFMTTLLYYDAVKFPVLQYITKTFIDEKMAPDIETRPFGSCQFRTWHTVRNLIMSALLETPKASISWYDNLQTISGVILSSINVLVYALRFKSCNTCSMVESQLHAYIRVLKIRKFYLIMY